MTLVRRVQRPAVPCLGGRPVARLILLFVSAGLLVGSTTPLRAATSTGNNPATLEPETQHVAVELDDTTTTPVELQINLANEGFSQSAPITYACGTRKAMLSVAVKAIDDDTLKMLRTTPGVRAVRQMYRQPGTTSFVVPSGRVVIKPKAGVSEAQIRDLLGQANCELVRKMGLGTTMYVARVKDEAAADSVGTAARLATSGLVDFAQPDMYREWKLHQVVIDDPLFPYQWHLQNRGQTGGIPGADVKAVEAWDTTMGQGSVVAVLDDSVQWQHPDLVDAVVARYNFDDGNDDPSPTKPFPFLQSYTSGFLCFADFCDYYAKCWGYLAHGTCTSGLVVAQANDIGVRGVAPLGSLIAERMLASTDADIAQAFYFAEQNGAQVISNSWGPAYPGTPTPDAIGAAIEDVSLNGRGGRGCLVMFSSGNDSLPIRKMGTFAALPEVMAIGATLQDDRLTCYSNFGAEQSIVAPGGGYNPGYDPTSANCDDPDITSTDITEVGYTPEQLALIQEFMDMFGITFCSGAIPGPLTGYNPPPPASIGLQAYQNNFGDRGYNERFNGTSAACPIAAGCAALVFSIDSTLTAVQVRNIIEHTADKVHPEGAAYDVVTGHSDMFGHGRVNAARAVQAATNGRVWPAPVTDLYDSSVANEVRFIWTNPPADAETVLILRAVGDLNFAPVDGTQYAVGDQVAPGVVVVANDLLTSYSDNAAPNGTLNYAVFVKNGNNFYSWGARVTVESKAVPNTPLASVTASPSAGPAPLPVLFSGGAIDPQNRPVASYTWDFGDGSAGGGASIEHTYSRAGQYLAKLTITVKDSAGQAIPATATVLVTVGPPSSGPTPTFILTLSANPRNGSPPLSVSFNVTVSPSTTLVKSYVWDFGDGSGAITTATGSTTHTYTAAGSYTAKITVTDSLGASLTAATSIAVGGGSGSQATRETTDTSAVAPAMCGAGVAEMTAMCLLMLAGVRCIGRRRQIPDDR
jgi:PKD repeat protein